MTFNLPPLNTDTIWAILNEEIADDTVNKLVWHYLGYRYDSAANQWHITEVAPEWKEEYGYAIPPNYDPMDGPAQTLGLTPTAETRGDEGFEEYWKQYPEGVRTSPVKEAIAKAAYLAGAAKARAEVEAKVAGVRAEYDKWWTRYAQRPEFRWENKLNARDAWQAALDAIQGNQ